MNNVTLVGQVSGIEEHENISYFLLSSKRMSGYADVIKCCATSELCSVLEDNMIVEITGELRTKNYIGDDNKAHLKIYVVVRSLKVKNTQTNDSNNISIDGYVCKKPIYRFTPNNIEICDLIIASNRLSGKSDYIPCIAWHKDAYTLSQINVGTHICICGRIQSREYEKKYDNGISEIKVAYEVSIASIDTIDKEGN